MTYKKIVIEGIDGAGKDTQIKKLVDFLENTEVVKYPDPESPMGKIIMDFLKKRFDFSPETQFLLYATDMLKDRQKIEKWVSEGKTVLFNRYIISTIAYQCSQWFSLEKAKNFIKLFDFPKPDVIFYLKIHPETAIKRKQKQKTGLDRFESKKDLLERVSDFYDKLEKENFLGKWIVIDGEKSPERVFEEIKKHL